MTKLLAATAMLVALCAPAVAGAPDQVACANESIKVERQAKKLGISYKTNSYIETFGICSDPDYGKRAIRALEQCIKTRQTNCTLPSE
jgi:hypothetical protein